uniref:Neur_chan_LBD domain-containing protein n=1 Tax=Rodentolepis nana TaxID=102285 RepID=A0A0R3TE05_RODNA
LFNCHWNVTEFASLDNPKLSLSDGFRINLQFTRIQLEFIQAHPGSNRTLSVFDWRRAQSNDQSTRVVFMIMNHLTNSWESMFLEVKLWFTIAPSPTATC